MSDVLPVDATITIRAETSVADPRHVQVHRKPDGASGRSLLLPRQRIVPLVRPSPSGCSRFPGVAHVLVAENVVTVGKDSGARRGPH